MSGDRIPVMYPPRTWLWSRREESPGGEEPRTAGAGAQRGIRRSIEAASGRVARRWRSQIRREVEATVLVELTGIEPARSPRERAPRVVFERGLRPRTTEEVAGSIHWQRDFLNL